MDETDQLYQEVILDHYKNPRNFGIIENHTHSAVGNNPLCGDHVELYLIIENDIIKDVKFKGVGCVISQASASIMTSVLKNKTISEARQLFDKFHKLLTTNISTNGMTDLGKLEVFSGVREFPVRVKCATLAWHTLINALENQKEFIEKG
ncbi:MAG: Fe-S cluster assembly sulfur transfer protein SufU [Candidatus Kapaibacteriales bacterium]